jgi:hypothetical protein
MILLNFVSKGSFMKLLPLEATVILSDDIVTRENKDGTVIVMKMDSSDKFCKIDGAAAELFKDLKKNIPLKTSVESISKNHGVSLATVHNDVSAFLTTLVSMGIVTLE